jgi:two-component system, cell cycle sensor histidine kinase and response regulator CckA
LRDRTILVVEDEEQVRTLIVRVLEKHGYTVIHAENGRKAVAAVSENIDSISLVITDVVMPEMGGAELLRELRALRADLPFLCMTGYTKEEVSSGDRMPNAHFIEKPFTPNALLGEVQNIIG